MVLYFKKLFLILFLLTIYSLVNHIVINEISKNDLKEIKNVNIRQIQIENAPAKPTKSYFFLKELIRKHNQKPVIINQELLRKYSKSVRISPKTLIILIQVHDRLQNLKSLVQSLSTVKYVNQTLIIFSHDYYNETINSFINEIKFAPVMQIFYPYMLQIYNEQYPGKSKNDCHVNMTLQAAKLSSCANWNFTDVYGFYRDYNVVQTKLHWLWKMAFVFDELIYTKSTESLNVLLLEEDFFMFPDALHVFRALNNKISNHSNQFVSLSDTYIDNTRPDFQNSSNLYSICRKHLCTSAMVFTRNLWSIIKEKRDQFCERDDYNWDWTLQHVVANLNYNCIYPTAARVVHFGKCGRHHKFGDCDASRDLDSFKSIREMFSKNLFPSDMTFHKLLEIPHVYDPNNGGWGDLRDRLLCKSFINKTFMQQLETIIKTKL